MRGFADPVSGLCPEGGGRTALEGPSRRGTGNVRNVTLAVAWRAAWIRRQETAKAIILSIGT